MPRDAYSTTFDSWDLLNRRLEEDGDIPLLSGQRAELEALLREAREMRNEYLALTSRAREASRKLQELMDRGRNLESRLRSGLRGFHGHDNSELLKYGIQPRRRRRRKTEEGPEEDASSEPSKD